jgi:hypothetical protein
MLAGCRDTPTDPRQPEKPLLGLSLYTNLISKQLSHKRLPLPSLKA